MKKKILKVLALLISLTAIILANEVTFKQLAQLASKDINSTIYVDKDIEGYTVDMNIADYQKKGEMISFFNTVLFDHDMYLKYDNRLKYYYIKTSIPDRKVLPASPVPAPVDKLYYYSYKIKNITNKDVVKTMSIFPKSKFVYLEQSDIISYACTKDEHESIKRMLETADNQSREALIKITLFSVKKDKMLSYGSDVRKLSFSMDQAYDTVFNNLLNVQKPSELVVESSLNFGFTLFALKGHNLVDINQEPTIRITNGKKATVKSGLNIGYLESSTSIQENQKTTTDQIKYRDVGIQINVMPKIKDDWVHLDLDLLSEELLSLDNNIPITQKISYKSSVTVRKGKPLLLTGIKKTSMKFEKNGVPLLSDIPLIGELFKKRTKTNDEHNINILIEVL